MNYLIKDTTREERQALVEKALMISLSGADKPSEEVIELAYEYIDGKKELEEIQKEVIQKYTKKEVSEWKTLMYIQMAY